MTDATKRTYCFRTKCRASEIGGAFDSVTTEVIHADGLIEWSVKGIEDGEYVIRRGTRRAEIAIDFDRIHAARISSGWSEVT